MKKITALAATFLTVLVGCSSTTTNAPIRDISPEEAQFIAMTSATCPVCGNAITAINNKIRSKCFKTLTITEMTDIETNSPLYQFVVATNSLTNPMTYIAKSAINGIECLDYNAGLYKTALPNYNQTINDRKVKEVAQQQLDQWLQSVMRI